MRKRILSIWLSVCMVLSMLPISAMAAEADASIGTRVEIIAFAPLDETEKSVPTGKAIEDLGLPETLTATVRTAVTAGSDVPDGSVQDSGNPNNLTEATPGFATPTDSGEQAKADEPTEPEWKITASDIPVTWTPNPEYDMDAEGVYVFTPVIEGYTVSADLPEITVTVGAAKRQMLRTASGAPASDPTKSITDSSLYFKDDGSDTQYSTDNTNWTSYTGDFTITGISTSDTDATHTVIVQSGTHNITLSDCSIGAATAEGTSFASAFSPFDIKGGMVNLTLTGDNKLYSAHQGKAGLHVDPNASLVVTAESIGSLDARCRKNSGTYYGRGAGIGGDNTQASGTISINGGEVTAYSFHGAGIGNGYNCNSAAFGDIRITGGTVVAQSDNGNGIGFGNSNSGTGGNVTITGGSVNAYGKTSPIGGTLKNDNGIPVQLYTLTLSDVSASTAVTALSTTPELDYVYGTSGMKTDDDGKLYVYLPAGRTAAGVTTAIGTYSGTISANAATLRLPQAQWGVAESDGSAPTSWVNSGTLADAMTYANNLESGKAYIQLQSDVNLSTALDFVSGKTTILDLNGKEINRGLTTAIENGNVINISGSLALCDSSTNIVANQGKITGGFSSKANFSIPYNGGGVGVNKDASFTMQGGNITGNKTTSDGGGGGGVYVGANCSFMMTGGSIANNEAKNWGGGVYVAATGSFTMLGGSITNNRSLNGGVYWGAPFTVGGTAVIVDNRTTGATPIECNAMRYNYPISVHSTTPLTSGAFIGVTAYKAPTGGGAVNVTGANSADYSSYFHSDNSGYMIRNDTGNTAQLVVRAPVIGTLTISDTFTAGHSLTLSDLNSKYKPSITDNGVAITEQGWQQYNPNSGGYWEPLIDGIIPDTGSAFTLRYYATYSGGTVYSNEVTLNVVGNTTSLALTASPESPQNTGTSITLTATLTGFFAGPGVNGQTITFKNGGTTLGTANLNAAGVAAYTWTPVTGTYSLTAEYAATAYNKSVTSSAVSYTVIVDPNIATVAAAKTALVDGTVNVAFGASQADKTAAVQAYVNGLLTGDATGVTAIVTYNSSTGKYDVAISKGSVNDSKSLSMTVNVAPDPDIAITTAAKTAAQNASYANMTQTAATDEDAIETALKNTAVTAVNNIGVIITINKVGYTAPIAGTSANPGGTNGSYTFTVTVSKGSQSETTGPKSITITATAYTGITDAQAVAAAKTALIDGSVNVAFGASQADKTAAVQAYVNGLLTGEATGVTAIVTYNSETNKYDATISKGSENDTKSLSMTVNIAPDPDIAIVAGAKTAAQGTSYSNMTQVATTDEETIKAALKNTAATAVNNSDVTITINNVAYTTPIAGTSANPSGTNGSYTFTVTVSKGSQSEITEEKTITITATAYTGITDAQAVSAAKTALIDGSVNVAFGASQADKTAAVQAYVNGLTGDATGVTAIVTYNSSTGKYDVAISKGSVNDSKSLSMAVNIAPDPDIAIVAGAKTAAQNAGYFNMTQTAATGEDAIKTALKNTAVTAVNNSDITITIDKDSYTPPIAGTSSNPIGTNGSYTFTVTVSKGSQSETTDQKTITITATPYTGGTGGGGSNGGSNGGGSTTPPSTKPTEPVTGSTENKATVDNKGNASVSLTDKNITDAIADAKAEAAKKGVNAGDITVVIHVTTGGKNADTVTVNLPKTTQEQVISNKISSVQLVIDRPDLTIGIDLAAVTEINRQAKADVQLSATRMDNTKLSGDAKAAIGNRPAYDLKALYGSGKSVTDFGKGSVSVEIPYTLQKGEIAGNVYAVYVDAKGKVTYLTDSSYDAKRGTVVFSTSHFSTYGVAYKASFNFTDIGGHWAKDDILFVANRGLMTGTSATTFSPGGSMTRGMFVTALGRLASADISAYKQSSFTDVKADAYYMGYIEWGVKNNILVGIGGNKFDPDGLVTREQMAVIMDRYATAIGFKLPEVHAQNVFADNAKIGAWAAPSVKRIQMAGVISGKNGNLFDPQGTATRAEVSAVLHRFVELAIFSDTAQGWTMNDSGKWMYYENGKPVTGKKDIDGAPYTFDQYGVTSDVPKNLRYATYTVQKGDSFWSISRKLDCTMSELERLNNKSRFSIIHPGDVLRVPEK